MPVNVAGQNGGKVWRQIAAANDVGRGGESEIARADRCPLDAMVNAEKSVVGVVAAPARLIDQRRKSRTDVIAFIWKTGEREPCSSHIHRERARHIEDVDVPMAEQPGVRKPRPLMVAWNDEDGDAPVGDALEGRIGLVGDARMRRRSVEDVAAVDDEVDFSRQCRRQRGRIVREEVESTAAATDTRPNWKVETEMGVGEKEDSNRVRHPYMVYMPVFVR